jgi:hypothetical protein
MPRDDEIDYTSQYELVAMLDKLKSEFDMLLEEINTDMFGIVVIPKQEMNRTLYNESLDSSLVNSSTE